MKILPSVFCCASAALDRDSPACCGPEWPCCVRPAGGSSLWQSEIAFSAGLSAASAYLDSLPAEQTTDQTKTPYFTAGVFTFWAYVKNKWSLIYQENQDIRVTVNCFDADIQKLTRSAYFLHRAASFSSGVAKELRACIKRTTSFPKQKKGNNNFFCVKNMKQKVHF